MLNTGVAGRFYLCTCPVLRYGSILTERMLFVFPIILSPYYHYQTYDFAMNLRMFITFLYAHVQTKVLNGHCRDFHWLLKKRVMTYV